MSHRKRSQRPRWYWVDATGEKNLVKERKEKVWRKRRRSIFSIYTRDSPGVSWGNRGSRAWSSFLQVCSSPRKPGWNKTDQQSAGWMGSGWHWWEKFSPSASPKLEQPQVYSWHCWASADSQCAWQEMQAWAPPRRGDLVSFSPTPQVRGPQLVHVC